MTKKTTYTALLRGINVGGHHKLPMADLRSEMERMGFENIMTILNSGNVIFESPPTKEVVLEEKIATNLESVFGFEVPILIRDSQTIHDLVRNNPFEGIEVTKDIRLYLSFLKQKPSIQFTTPWTSDDGAFQIIEIRDRTICSVLNLAITKTPKGMNALEQLFGKNTTTRNWNTLLRIADKLNL